MTITVGYDDNLGCPDSVLDDDAIEAVPYHDIDALIADLRTGSVLAAFVPAGSLPHLSGFDYVVLVQAEVDGSRLLEADLRVRKGGRWSPADVASGAVRMGAINTSCTTTYWASQIALMSVLPQGSAIHFVHADGFQDLFDKALSGEHEASMIWDRVAARQHGRDAALDTVLRVTDLPTPVVCAHPSLTAGQRAAVASAFCAAHESGNALFTGFAAPDLDAIARFTEQCAAAQAHFGPELIAPRG